MVNNLPAWHALLDCYLYDLRQTMLHINYYEYDFNEYFDCALQDTGDIIDILCKKEIALKEISDSIKMDNLSPDDLEDSILKITDFANSFSHMDEIVLAYQKNMEQIANTDTDVFHPYADMQKPLDSRGPPRTSDASTQDQLTKRLKFLAPINPSSQPDAGGLHNPPALKSVMPKAETFGSRFKNDIYAVGFFGPAVKELFTKGTFSIKGVIGAILLVFIAPALLIAYPFRERAKGTAVESVESNATPPAGHNTESAPSSKSGFHPAKDLSATTMPEKADSLKPVGAPASVHNLKPTK